jgi:hypothetical protein
LPLHNPIGFVPTDYFELALAGLFLLLAFTWQPWIAPLGTRFSRRPGWCMITLAVLPIALRLILLPGHAMPSPYVYDEFSHLLVADTLRHFRLANPPHALPQFFETFFVVQRPTYSSIYPIGQGLTLALGWVVFGFPWAGVLVSTGVLCALCYWMLRGWVPPGLALLGGCLAVFEFGPLNPWTNTYWGGGYTASAGCLVFGALPRLRNGWHLRHAALLGLGLGMHLLSRPFESIFLLVSVILFFLPELRSTRTLRLLTRPAAAAALACLPFISLVLLQNRQITGSWFTLPYTLSQYQYGVPASFTFQPHPVPHSSLTHEQEMDYKMQRAFRTVDKDTLITYLKRLLYRIRYYRFYFYPVLYLALIAYFVKVREYRFLWVVLTVLIFALGTNFYPLFLTHYIASLTCLFLLISVEGLRVISRWRADAAAARVLIWLCIAQFAYAWATVDLHYPERRIEVNKQLGKTPGNLLVLVRYWPQHIFQEEWVYNGADIDKARIVWARDLGDVEDQQLLHYYPERTVLLLEPDAHPPRLTPWKPEPPKPPDKPQPPKQPTIVFEPVL